MLLPCRLWRPVLLRAALMLAALALTHCGNAATTGASLAADTWTADLNFAPDAAPKDLGQGTDTASDAAKQDAVGADVSVQPDGAAVDAVQTDAIVDATGPADAAAGTDAQADVLSDVLPDVEASPDGGIDAGMDVATGVDAAADVGVDGAAGSDGSAVASIALADLAAKTAIELCKANFSTCTPADKIPYATQAGCVAAVTAADATDFQEIIDKVNAGKIVYDGAAADACLTLAALHCDDLDFVDGPPVCQTVFKGKAFQGAKCTMNVECASDFCFFGTDNCPGMCKNRKPLGAACTDNDKCVAGSVCFGGQCVADVPKGVGAGCSPLTCLDGLYCDSNDTCAPLGKLGAACDIVGSCEVGLHCIDNGTGGVCKTMPKKGEPCAPDPWSDASTLCAQGLVCFNDGISADVGTCIEKVAIGSPCVNSSACGGWDVHCVGPAGQATCQLLSTKGGPCQAADLNFGEWGGCLDPWTCVAGVCSDVPTLGQTCADDLLKECAVDLACNPLTSKCEALPGLNETCYGLCVTGLECVMPGDTGTCAKATCP